MKSTALFCSSLAVVGLVFQTVASSALPSSSQITVSRSLTQAAGSSSSTEFSEETGAITRVCFISPNVWRPGHTYNDPTAFRPGGVIDCCFACQDDKRCLAWTYDSVTGACALKDEEPEPFGDERFLSSAGEGIDGTYSHRRTILPDGTTMDSLGPVSGREVAPLGRCYSEQGVAYPGGNVLRRVRTGSHDECCGECRNDPDCFSWYRNANTRRCVLNRNVPSRRNRGRNYAGASTI